MSMEKKQVVIIGGGETFDTYEEYLDFLRNTITYNPDKIRKANWKDNLQADLGRKFEVLTPSMPNKLNATYKEWEIYFGKVVPHLRDGVILVGHSLGGLFLFRYLWLNGLPVELGGLLMVAAPLPVAGQDAKGFADFCLYQHSSYEMPDERAHVFHSTDDTIVPYSDSMIRCGGVTKHEFSDRGHFISDKHFGELVRVIKKL